MSTRKKIIRKPSFLITYAVSAVIMFILSVCIGLLVYAKKESEYDSRVMYWKKVYELDLDSILERTLYKGPEDVTREDLVNIKAALLSHYTDTEQYTEVYFNCEKISDACRSALLTYLKAGDKSYTLELADSKYLEYFDVPEVNLHQYRSEDVFEGFRTHSFIGFACDEFYLDTDNCTFIPVLAKIITPDERFGPEIRITPDPEDIEGYNLVKIANTVSVLDSRQDYAFGMIEGYEGEVEEDQLVQTSGGMNDNHVPIGTRKTWFATKSYNEVYGQYIKIGQGLLVLCALILALIPATIVYNINRRKYEIYEYRRQTTNAMAHDLKTPIASILAYAELLENGIDSDNREHYAAKISEKASQMNRIVNDMLMFSRSETALASINRREVNTAEIIRDIISENEQQISNKSLEVVFDESSSPVLDTDPDLFRQALGNLINNAVIYSKDNTAVIIECDAGSIRISNVMAEPVDDVRKLREPFVKGNASRQSGGTGLGLAIAENDLAMLKYKLEIKVDGDKFVAVICFM
ncbi:Signal transduction histidine kinase [Ruminococcaceae bacterium YRB3002]|nr:Signal transduction histidine kinase [Ruminococcaceae bacterium YRB3002]